MTGLAVELVSSNDRDRVLSIAVNGVVYEYEFDDRYERARGVANKMPRVGAPGRALGWLARNAKTVRRRPDPRQLRMF
jgi:hypothetical protein